MLRIVQCSSSAGTKSYYAKGDYYLDGEQELPGVWHGEGAKRLALAGSISRKDWDALCDNINPQTGGVLTPRQKTNRRVAYDFNFHCPKSVSLLYGLTRGERLLDAFRESVRETMGDMEREMKTRVRVAGADTDRVTGNMVWGEFVHLTSRPVDGVPDPHLHAHCVVFNTTHDSVEDRWKAGQFADLKADAPYFEALFHARLAERMQELGLPVERTRKGWEIAGFDKALLGKCSRRTTLIEAEAKERGITDAAEKSELGAKTRERKRGDLSTQQLQAEWSGRLTDAERSATTVVAERIGGESPQRSNDPAPSLDYAMGHHFERKAVVPERKLLATALKRSIGEASPEAVLREFREQPLLRGERDGRMMATTKDVLAEEQAMIDYARRGRGTCQPFFAGTHVFANKELSKSQRSAVEHILHSRDSVILVRGPAGTGKTWMLREAVSGIEAAGRKVLAFAPSAEASRGVLRDEGFENAETVARLLLDEKLQAEGAGQVILVDEASLLGSRSMKQLFDVAEKNHARLILVGDKRQHKSVERGSPLHLLEKDAGLVPAEIKEIQRQKGVYMHAVRALSRGDIAGGFKLLDGLGWIRELPDDERYQTVAKEYLATLEAGKTALIVAPSHRECAAVTDEVRRALKESGRIGTDEREFTVLKNRNLTEAERTDPMNYEQGDVLVYHQNAKGVVKGDRRAVGLEPPPLDQAARFQVFTPETLRIASGDQLRITKGGSTADGLHRLNNGSVFTVNNFDRDGNIVLTNGWTVGKDFGFLSHSVAITSHASQGKTVDRCFVCQSELSLPASSIEQFYVSASRARDQVRIYTSSKDDLFDAVSRHDDRLTATGFVASIPLRDLSARETVPSRDQETAYDR